MIPMLLTEGTMPSSCIRKRILIMVIGSMLIVIPMGRANLTTLGLILFFSSRHLDVMGNAARLEEVAIAVGSTSMTLNMYLYGFLRVTRRNIRGMKIQAWINRTTKMVNM